MGVAKSHARPAIPVDPRRQRPIDVHPGYSSLKFDNAMRILVILSLLLGVGLLWLALDMAAWG